MLKGIDVNQRIEYTSVEDNSDPRTTFIFRPLSGADMIDLADFKNGGDIQLSGESIINMLDKSIVEIKNYEPASEKRDILRSLPPSVLTELVQYAGKLNNLTEEDKKKL